MSIPPVIAWSCLLLLSGGRAPHSESAITLERTPATVKRITFDAQNPPAEMPQLNGDEAALTQYDFNCAVNLKYEIIDRAEAEGGKLRVTVKLRAIQVRLTLENRIYLPTNANLPLRAHEEGHREINERVYDELAETTARTLAEQMMARQWTGEGSDEESAGKAATNAAVQELGDAYVEAVAGRASRVGDAFDEITMHGRRPVNVARAINRAFEKIKSEDERSK
jgi:hypothetical protein